MSPKDFRHSIKVPSSLHTLTVEPLTASRFRPYGQVIAAPEEATSSMANQGSAQRFNFIAEIINHRSPLANSCYPGSLPHPDSNSTQKHISLSPSIGIPPAVPNLCLFRSTPRNLPFQLSLLERHKYSTQMFVPMTPPGGSRGYLVVVAANSVATDKPDLSTLKAFLATSSQGFNYQPGMETLNTEMCF